MTNNDRYVSITVKGLVQGVGFRPFIAECAEKLNIRGIVRNSGGIVIIIALADDDTLNKFAKTIENAPPRGSVVSSVIIEDITREKYTEECGKYIDEEMKAFKIVDSSNHEDNVRLLPPDLPICDNCVKELLDNKNRRYRYPFISCTSCGPRFSIMHTVPYDRETTTMDIFKMCPDCFDEYTKQGNIRRHAQTISCHKCGPQLTFIKCDDGNMSCMATVNEPINGHEKDNEAALNAAVSLLKKGEIGAILDIGGFHFAFSPYLSEPASRLRIWKMREAKPFAVMFPDMDFVRKYCEVSPKEEELLESNPRPIVLLSKKKTPDNSLEFAEEVLAGSDRIGAMLPCSPLQILLLKETGPLVMTSGNRGGEPIVTSVEVMKGYLGTGGPDFMLSHDRKILTPLDDSIYQINGNVVQIIRRARGIVPWPVDLPISLQKPTFAAGGDLKAVFALGKADKAYLSAHFSDLDDLEASRARDKAIDHMEELLDITPEIYVCDKHPGYVSAKKNELLCGSDAKSVKVQHHFAHVMTVAAERDIMGDFIGIAYDGTGYGEDGSIWGSEFFRCNIEDDRNERKVVVSHRGSLLPVKMTGGDEGSKDASKTLVCYLHEAYKKGYIKREEIDTISRILKDTFSDHKMPDIKIVEAALDHNINTIMSTSMGRLFDAVSALLGICCYNSYEGECPTKLEIYANNAQSTADLELEIIKEQEPDENNKTDKEYTSYYLNGVKLVAKMGKMLIQGEDNKALALGFHKALALSTVNMAETISGSDEAFKKIAIGGGTFLNRILNTNIQDICDRKGYKLYQNSVVPPGDGGIALGQLYLSQCRIKE